MRSSLLCAMASLALGVKATLPFGHLGPENVVLYLNGFHFVSGNSEAEISANHFCTVMSDDFLQCAVYTTSTTPTRLAGIEYIISAALFETLDYEERQLWHSHAYEVTSGFLIEPGMPDPIDHAAMEVLVGTYGKTVHSWRWDQTNSTLPLGIPELVMGYTGDSQITPSFVTQRDELFEVNTTEIRASREDIEAPQIIDGADSWKKGFVLTYGLVNKTENTSFASEAFTENQSEKSIQEHGDLRE